MTERGIVDVQAELLEEARRQTRHLSHISVAVQVLTVVVLLTILFGFVIATQ